MNLRINAPTIQLIRLIGTKQHLQFSDPTNLFLHAMILPQSYYIYSAINSGTIILWPNELYLNIVLFLFETSVKFVISFYTHVLVTK